MRISDWSSDVCSSDLRPGELRRGVPRRWRAADRDAALLCRRQVDRVVAVTGGDQQLQLRQALQQRARKRRALAHDADDLDVLEPRHQGIRSEEHTSELQSLMRITYAAF